jgi:hypothetical protein
MSEHRAKSFLTPAYSSYLVVVARRTQDQARSAIFQAQATVSLDEFCAALYRVSASLVALHLLKPGFNYLRESFLV